MIPNSYPKMIPDMIPKWPVDSQRGSEDLRRRVIPKCRSSILHSKFTVHEFTNVHMFICSVHIDHIDTRTLRWCCVLSACANFFSASKARDLHTSIDPSNPSKTCPSKTGCGGCGGCGCGSSTTCSTCSTMATLSSRASRASRASSCVSVRIAL